eukprot:658439-Pleurochrysis_carterae.AAC.1
MGLTKDEIVATAASGAMDTKCMMEEWRLIVPSITEHAGETFVQAMNDTCCNLAAVFKNTI